MKVALVDDGVPKIVARDYHNIKTKYLSVKHGMVHRQRLKQYQRKMTHAGLCFIEFAEFVKIDYIELYSVEVDFKPKGDIKDMITALEWCEENEMKIINLSIGSQNYWDYFKLEPILKRLYEKEIYIIAAHSNDYQFSFPAISKYSFSARFDSGDFLKTKNYIVLNNFFSKREYIFSKQDIFERIKKYVDTQGECNSIAAPLLSAILTNLICIESNSPLIIFKQNYSDESKKQYILNFCMHCIKKVNCEIPILAFKGKQEKISEYLQYFTKNILESGYEVLVISDTVLENDLPYINLSHILSICCIDITQAAVFIKNYSNVDIIMFYGDSEKMELLLNTGIADILISDDQSMRYENEEKRFENKVDLFEGMLSILK